jgi:hypothetical protein
MDIPMKYFMKMVGLTPSSALRTLNDYTMSISMSRQMLMTKIIPLKFGLISHLNKGLDKTNTKGWTIVEMKKDRVHVFALSE